MGVKLHYLGLPGAYDLNRCTPETSAALGRAASTFLLVCLYVNKCAWTSGLRGNAALHHWMILFPEAEAKQQQNDEAKRDGGIKIHGEKKLEEPYENSNVDCCGWSGSGWLRKFE